MLMLEINPNKHFIFQWFLSWLLSFSLLFCVSSLFLQSFFSSNLHFDRSLSSTAIRLRMLIGYTLVVLLIRMTFKQHISKLAYQTYKMHTSNVFYFLRHNYIRYLNVLIELRPNPGYILAQPLKSGLLAIYSKILHYYNAMGLTWPSASSGLRWQIDR